MNSVICTLFERHFHRGLVGLVNSLNANGYKGDIYAGYLGNLPWWAKIEKSTAFDNLAIKTFTVNENIRIQFVELKTEYHLTNYKPIFMKWLLDGPAKGADNIFYFDTDIVVNYQWNFFEEWVGYGVALCEDIASPMSLNHPRRMAWHQYFDKLNVPVKFNQNAYVNGGFVGLNKKDVNFISLWITIQEQIAPIVGGLQWSSISGKRFTSKDHMAAYFPFKIPDQDALNITVGAYDGVVTIVGKEAMGFQSGQLLMLHALGSKKPWRNKYLKNMFLGIRPRTADKVFWDSVSSPIKLYSHQYIFRKTLSLNIAAFVGRFYGKS
jgi:hypothetical protein